MRRRADPEPLTIIASIAAVAGAAFSTLNYWRSHHRALPHRIRSKLLSHLDRLASETRHLRTDVDEAESIFRNAQFPQGRTVRLGNGALLTLGEFQRYERVADHIFARLKKLHKLTLIVERLAFDLPFIDKRQTANVAGDALARTESLIRSRDFSIDEAWSELRALGTELEKMITELRADLSSGL